MFGGLVVRVVVSLCGCCFADWFGFTVAGFGCWYFVMGLVVSLGFV